MVEDDGVYAELDLGEYLCSQTTFNSEFGDLTRPIQDGDALRVWLSPWLPSKHITSSRNIVRNLL